MTIGELSRALREAGILDNLALDATGAAVVLPYGLELLGRFRSLVHDEYQASGLAEHEYPFVVPMSVAEPTGTLVDLDNRLLLVGTTSELAAGKPPFTLTPTGEMVIYAHWSRLIASRGDLPVRMYRRARYFRPVSRGKHAGRGVFHSLEHDDVFELHCAHVNRADQQEDMGLLQTMLAGLIRRTHVPVLWSTRPPWTNRAEIANLAVAADAPLPVRSTAQVASIYDQGTRFSRAYRVGFRESGVFHYTEQLAGYVSRRLLMVHLMLGLRQRGGLFLHPDLAPVQVLLLGRWRNGETPPAAQKLLHLLRDHGVAAREIACDSSAALSRARRTWNPRGVPVILQVFAPRTSADDWKAVVNRSDTNEEQSVYLDDPVGLVDEIRALLADVAEAFAAGAWDFAGSRIRAIDGQDLTSTLDQRLVAVIPLEASEAATRTIDASHRGEVLGFCRAEHANPCSVTGKAVNTVAFVSPRL